MKTCTKCHIEKDESEFNSNKNFPGGLNCYCRDCSRELARIYYKQNSEKIKEQTRQIRIKNPNARKWSKKTRDKRKEPLAKYKKMWYAKHSEILDDKILRRLLKNHGKYSDDDIRKLPQLLDIKKVQIIYYRITKLKNKKNEKVNYSAIGGIPFRRLSKSEKAKRF